MARKHSKNTRKTRRRRLGGDTSSLGRPFYDEVGTNLLRKQEVESGTARTDLSSGDSDKTAIEQGNASEEHDQVKFHRPKEPDSGLITKRKRLG